MGSRFRIIFIVFTLFIFLVDGLVYTGLLMDFQMFRKNPFVPAYWIITVLFVAGLAVYGRKFVSGRRDGFPAHFFTFTGLFMAFYLPKLLYLVFLFIENVLIAIFFPVYRALGGQDTLMIFYEQTLFTTVSLFSLPIAGVAFLVIIGGMLFGKFNFRVRRLEACFPDLPPSFEGFRILHISDLHLGSLTGYRNKIRRAIGLINQEKADLILFTGDLVNDVAEETRGWTQLLGRMQSGYGRFAILGNHDYGEFAVWPDEASRQGNLDRLISAFKEAGFDLLLNDSVKIEKSCDAIFILGVENWGLPPFKQYGDLAKAMKNVPDGGFRILLSHDPSHWDREVVGKTSIQLTLSGHTHGFQFGIRNRRFKWSPVQMKYPRWIGMYREGSQLLHVSPGLGFIGYAGRIGIPPEITVLTLRGTSP